MSQLSEERAARRRESAEHNRHIAEIRQELERAHKLRSVDVKMLQAQLGSPILDRLILALWDLVEAAHPLTGAPIEDTMRTTNPSSSRDEGASTRHHRNTLDHSLRRLRRIATDIEQQVGGARDDANEDKRWAAHVRWHITEKSEACRYC